MLKFFFFFVLFRTHNEEENQTLFRPCPSADRFSDGQSRSLHRERSEKIGGEGLEKKKKGSRLTITIPALVLLVADLPPHDIEVTRLVVLRRLCLLWGGRKHWAPKSHRRLLRGRRWLGSGSLRDGCRRLSLDLSSTQVGVGLGV